MFSFEYHLSYDNLFMWYFTWYESICNSELDLLPKSLFIVRKGLFSASFLLLANLSVVSFASTKYALTAYFDTELILAN